MTFRRLSLTSKRLRDILITKEARHIWKTAIAFVPYLAECPTDLNEPQYVCLLYSSECDMTDCTSRGTKLDWFHRVRFCSACHDVKMKNEWSLRFRRGFDIGIERSTAVMVLKYSNSYDVTRLATNYRLYRGNGMGKGDERHHYIEAVKNAGHEYDALSGEEAIMEYLLLLKEKRNYRVQTGTAMVKWKNKQLLLVRMISLQRRMPALKGIPSTSGSTNHSMH
ncbi:hypothetical protein M407DRAFT_235976 [Tulasnella calospora MUT 4182]|uniref:F-box domain-containing protein n=1 Tax=Tulasnella calospora MUT 4182 TaxID=1051891 RepID=A0A0C3QUL1_9AGAM|nr:hypothetical protein M407DRAFT_235976 [Tulasnella calospora MUT 4182]